MSPSLLPPQAPFWLASRLLLPWMRRSHSHVHATCAWQLLFDEIDADRSGLLDRDEISALLQSLGSEMTDAQVNAAMSLMDQDG